MRALVDADMVEAVGLSNFDRDHIEQCLAVGAVDVVQEGLSPIDHLETLERVSSSSVGAAIAWRA